MKTIAIAVVSLVAAVAAWNCLPAALGITCEQCNQPMSDHTVASKGLTHFGEEYCFYRCPNGTIWAQPPR